LGTALVGAVLIAGLSSAFIANVQASPDVPASVKQEASVKLDGAMPFISDAQLEAALTKAQVPQNQIDGIMQANREARVEALHLALAVAALIAIVSLFFTGLIPSRPVGPEAPPGVS
jgi:hypothetical protein